MTAPEASRAIRHVLLVGPDDDARRALHLLLDRTGRQVAAVADLADALGFLASSQPCDVVLAAAELAAALVAHAPAVVAVLRPRDVALASQLLDAGVADVVAEPLDELALVLALRHVGVRAGRPAAPAAAPALVGSGEAMRALRQTIERRFQQGFQEKTSQKEVWNGEDSLGSIPNGLICFIDLRIVDT